ncbi:MAG: manganese efflux pump [Clostridia bacterium]|nr:manganese efflux pump [Clostridia bacterium]
MGTIELLLLSVGLAMDAFAVSVCKGLAVPKIDLKKIFTVGIWFGGFQALMPLIGYLLGAQFENFISRFSSWIAFILLSLIGGNMIREALSKDDDDEKDTNASFAFGTMLVMAIATSIDALAVGITFAALSVNIWIAIAFIGSITFILSGVGLKIGNVFGAKYKSKAEFAGGLILVLLGIKILLEHFGIL